MYIVHNTIIVVPVVGDAVVLNCKQDWMKSAGLGIQLPLLSHVTLRVVSVVELRDISFSQVSVKTEPSRVELKFRLMFPTTSGNPQSAVWQRNYYNNIIFVSTSLGLVPILYSPYVACTSCIHGCGFMKRAWLHVMHPDMASKLAISSNDLYPLYVDWVGKF